MIKRFFLIAVLAITFLASSLPVYAQAAGNIYVDTAWTGSEDGTQSKPYNTETEGINAARAMPGGAYVYVKLSDGVTWSAGKYYAPYVSGATGTSLADTALYALLAVLALGLILVGWRFQRKSRQLKNAR